ncbi:hypothetical protein LUZ60_013295 [Juncus effusus]|nr:hypothetical protein LUZ60_013295 [Juncus effusus]
MIIGTVKDRHTYSVFYTPLEREGERERMEGKSKVCVTGASGYIGSSLVKKLLDKGYTVHATVRNIGDESKMGLLKSLPGSNSQLLLFEADIYDSTTFEPAIKGCEFVFLLATPLQHNPLSSKDTTEAALDGLHTIFRLCEQTGTVRRVVYTGSVVAASPWNEDSKDFKDFIDESCWTAVHVSYPHSTDHLKDYTSSKTLSEKEILNYNNKEGKKDIEVVSLACGLVGGDTILSYVPGSMQSIISPLTGSEFGHGALKFLQGLLGSVPLVHIDDVCEAHVFCIEKPSMAGRFLCVADYPVMKYFVDYFEEKYPDLRLIKEVEGNGEGVKASSRKLLDMGFEYKHTVDEILGGSVECAKRLEVL